MIKYFQPWCAHSICVGPIWDALAEAVNPDGDSSSVFIYDVSCADYEDICKEAGILAYSTIRYYIKGTEHDCSGGLSFETLKEFVKDNFKTKCDIHNIDGTCQEKAKRYAIKWMEKTAKEVSNEIERLKSMKQKSMTLDLKYWLQERMHILSQLANVKTNLDVKEL
mmetsp:Transcript_9145/g.13334  ORF Transcript_9145/g.13334 Transcript_9145/m.13334 type:complete len:166 (-) Transcript_9145:19-516(-)